MPCKVERTEIWGGRRVTQGRIFSKNQKGPVAATNDLPQFEKYAKAWSVIKRKRTPLGQGGKRMRHSKNQETQN